MYGERGANRVGVYVGNIEWREVCIEGEVGGVLVGEMRQEYMEGGMYR